MAPPSCAATAAAGADRGGASVSHATTDPASFPPPSACASRDPAAAATPGRRNAAASTRASGGARRGRRARRRRARVEGVRVRAPERERPRRRPRREPRAARRPTRRANLGVPRARARGFVGRLASVDVEGGDEAVARGLRAEPPQHQRPGRGPREEQRLRRVRLDAPRDDVRRRRRRRLRASRGPASRGAAAADPRCAPPRLPGPRRLPVARRPREEPSVARRPRARLAPRRVRRLQRPPRVRGGRPAAAAVLRGSPPPVQGAPRARAAPRLEAPEVGDDQPAPDRGEAELARRRRVDAHAVERVRGEPRDLHGRAQRAAAATRGGFGPARRAPPANPPDAALSLSAAGGALGPKPGTSTSNPLDWRNGALPGVSGGLVGVSGAEDASVSVPAESRARRATPPK